MKLKRGCPFCQCNDLQVLGPKSTPNTSTHAKGYQVECTNCGSRGPCGMIDAAAAKAVWTNGDNGYQRGTEPLWRDDLVDQARVINPLRVHPVKTAFANNTPPAAWKGPVLDVRLVEVLHRHSRVLVNEHTAFSFGPCVIDKGHTVRPANASEAAAFYGLYAHDAEGLAHCVGDAEDIAGVHALLRQSAGTWLVVYARHIVTDLSAVDQAMRAIEQLFKPTDGPSVQANTTVH